MSKKLPANAAVGNLTDLATRINREHKAAVGTLKRGLEHALGAGHLLLEAKELVPHGDWLPWLIAHCPQLPERTAQVYMRLARRMPKSARPADLTITQALELLIDGPDLAAEQPPLVPLLNYGYPDYRQPPTIVSQCVDCGLGTFVALEYHYLVRSGVWHEAWGDRLKPWHRARGQQILCIACLEKRLGRTLVRADFVTREPDLSRMSGRLLSRLVPALPSRGGAAR